MRPIASRSLNAMQAVASVFSAASAAAAPEARVGVNGPSFTALMSLRRIACCSAPHLMPSDHDPAGPERYATRLWPSERRCAGSAKVAPIETVSPLQAIGAEAARHGATIRFADAPPVNLGPAAIPSYALTPAGGAPGQHGLLAQYFNNATWQGTPVESRVEPYVDENALPPAGVDSAQKYSVRWSGTFIPPVSGSYTLSVTTHDASTLYLGGHQIAASQGGFPAQTAGSTVSLTAGTPYPIEVDYATNGMAVAELSWQPPAGADGPLIDVACRRPGRRTWRSCSPVTRRPRASTGRTFPCRTRKAS
jgi:PA14 domain